MMVDGGRNSLVAIHFDVDFPRYNAVLSLKSLLSS